MNYDIELKTLSGEADHLTRYRNRAALVVNVASECGLTPQYRGLQALQQRYGDRGFDVLAFPCNQFGGQEPGTPQQIREFCDTRYAVGFPMFEKTEVNGAQRHPLYAQLTAVADAQGQAGDVEWNFEKFLISSDGSVTRFRPGTEPEDPALVAAIESALP